MFGEARSDCADCQQRVASVKGDTLLGDVFSNDMERKWGIKSFKSWSSPVTSRDPVLLAFPRSFSAKQVYLPSSARVTLTISRLPSSQINTLRRDVRKFLAGQRGRERARERAPAAMKYSSQCEGQKSSECCSARLMKSEECTLNVVTTERTARSRKLVGVQWD